MPHMSAQDQGLRIAFYNFSCFSSVNFTVRVTDGDSLDVADIDLMYVGLSQYPIEAKGMSSSRWITVNELMQALGSS